MIQIFQYHSYLKYKNWTKLLMHHKFDIITSKYNWLQWFEHVAVLQTNCGDYECIFSTFFVYHIVAVYVKIIDLK